MADLSPAVIRAINGYLNTTAEIDNRVINFVTSQWNRLGSYRDADILRFARAVAPVVEGAQSQIGSLTDGYLALLESAVNETNVRPIGISREVLTSQSLRGVNPVELFQRPGLTIWNGLSKGESLGKMIPQGLQRAISLTKTNLQLANTHTSRLVLANKDNVVGYRRMLTGGESCGLCFVASTQRYHKKDLMPIHPGCDCKVSPIYGSRDPGQVINSNVSAKNVDLSDRFQSFTGKQERTSDLRSQVVTHNHGEIGPVLAVRGQTFTGPDDLAA